jgi:hypothetical protein
MIVLTSIKRSLLLAVFFLTAASLASAQDNKVNTDESNDNPTSKSLDGFVVWAEGSGCDRELKFNKIVDGKVGEKQTAVEQGIGADIHVHISYDGAWIAFSRATKRFDTKHGGCDYHAYDNFDLYIAKINNGNNLPAQAIKIDHGYWASWGDDATDPDKPKTLYYNRYRDKCIMKTTVLPDGSFSPPVKHADIRKGMSHVQCSPDGKYVAHRPSGMKVTEVSTGNTISGAGGGGCHPCWGPRSKYLIWSKNQVCRVDGGSGRNLGKAGVGSYWQGISNDAYFDEGKLWIIGRMRGGKNQNAAGSVEFREVDIANGGWAPGPTTKVGEGTAADIHVYLSTESTKAKQLRHP